MKLVEPILCTGCSACVNACQTGALAMSPDEEGFQRPVLNTDECVGCNACERACPLLRVDELVPEQIDKVPYCGCSLDEDVWRQSTSGGAFSEICNSLAVKQPVVFGARFDGLDLVKHSYSDGIGGIGVFRKSKYVQSDIGSSLRDCKQFLQSGRFVIFSGTPCQIAGLRAYLGREYENLLTVEFICHGVGSPRVFRDCLDVASKSFRKPLIKYGFRSKANWPINVHTSHYEFGTGETREITVDLYNEFFLNQLCLRPSCMENCRFRREARMADITLADCRGERQLYPDKDNKNWSVVVANTLKGKDVILQLKKNMDLRPYSIDLLAHTNPLYFRTTKGNANRTEFFRRYIRGERLQKIARRLIPHESLFMSLVRRARRGVWKIKRLVNGCMHNH